MSIESVLATVRAIWDAVEGSAEADKSKLKKDITSTVNRLKGRIDKKLTGTDQGASQGSLFSDEAPQVEKVVTPPAQSQPRLPEPMQRICSDDVSTHAMKHLPKLGGCVTVDDVREHLTENLQFNSEATRRRHANYIINRFFPEKTVHQDLLIFASAYEDTPALGEALFYLTARIEKIVALVAEEVVFPALAQGSVARSNIRDFVQTQFPESKSAKRVAASIVTMYQTFGIASANRTRLTVSLREGDLASFAYVLHLEFLEPGMYAFEKMLEGPMHKWLLWDQEWMIRQLYQLREVGLLSKVSEIDGMRQFTIKHTLADAVQPIVDLAKESPA